MDINIHWKLFFRFFQNREYQTGDIKIEFGQIFVHLMVSSSKLCLALGQKRKSMYVCDYTWTTLLKITDPILFLQESAKNIDLYFTTKKSEILHLLSYLMWSRWLKFLVNDSSVLKLY